MPSELYKMDGNGSTIKIGEATTAAVGVNTIGVPGFTREEINAANLNTTGFIPKLLAKLKNAGDFTVNVDLKASAAFSGMTDNSKLTITFPDSAGSVVLYGSVKSMSEAKLNNNESPTVDVAITVTNLTSAGVKTDPVITFGSGT